MTETHSMRSTRGVALFLVIAFGWSWAWAAAIWAGDAMRIPVLFQSLAFLFMCGPAVAAIVCAARYDKGRRIAVLGLRLRFNAWLVWAWGIPLLLIAGAMLVDWAGPQVSPADPGARIAAMAAEQGQAPQADGLALSLLGWLTVGSTVQLAPLINAPLMASEELGWRGWLWDRWRRFGFWRGNIAIGAVWGLWHAPLIALGHNYPGMPVSGPALMVLFCIMLAPLIGLVREKGGVWHACLFHGTVNATAGVSIMMLSQGAAFPWLGALGIGGAVAGSAAWALLALYLRRHPPAAH